MDPSNFNFFGFDSNAYYAMVAQQQAAQAEQPQEAAQGHFEQHLEAAAQPHAPNPRGQRYQAAPGDEDLIKSAGDAEVARGTAPATVKVYKSSLRRLSQALHHQDGGLSLSGLNDNAVNDYANTLFPDDRQVHSGVVMLTRYRGSAPADPHRRYQATPGDADLIRRAADAARAER
ncbi:hypothetical protein, partial [Rhizobium grahamii]